MNKIIKFELKKYKRQYKFLIIFSLIFLLTILVYGNRYINQGKIKERALNHTEKLQREIGQLEHRLKGINSEESQIQAEELVKTGAPMFQWRNAIHSEEWDKIPEIKKDFLEILVVFEEKGGYFGSLYGDELNIEIEKNNWIIRKGLAYEDEEYSLLPQLILYKTTSLVFSIWGIIFLSMIFFLSIPEEYENSTILTLETQPIERKNIILGKFISMLIVTLSYILLVFIIGIAISLIGSRDLSFNYPLVFFRGDNYFIMPIGEYILKLSLVFLAVSIFTISILILISSMTKSIFNSIIISLGVFFAGIAITDGSIYLQSKFNPFYGFLIEKIILNDFSEILLYTIVNILILVVLIVLANILVGKINVFSGGDKILKPIDGEKLVDKSDSQKLIFFEKVKSKRQGKVKSLIGAFLFLVIISSFYLNDISKEKEKTYIKSLENRRTNTESILEKYKEDLEKLKKGDASVFGIEIKEEDVKKASISSALEVLPKQIEFHTMELNYIENALEGYENNHWEELLNHQLLDIRVMENEFKGSNIHGSYDNPVNPEFSIKATRTQNEMLLERGLRPLFPGGLLLTAYGDFNPANLKQREFAQKFVEENEKYDSSGLYSLYLFYNKYIYIIPIILLVYLKGLGFNYEIGKKKPLNLMRTQPIKLEDIYNGKLVNGLIDSFLFIFIIFIVIILSGTILNRFGDLDYPILCYDLKDAQSTAKYTVYTTVDGNYHFIDLGLYLFKSIILTLVSIVFLLSFTSLISNIGKNRLITMILSTIIVIVGYMISLKKYIKAIFISPFIYLNIPKIINGEMAWKLNNGNLNFLYGIVVLGMYSILCWILGKRTSKLYERD